MRTLLSVSSAVMALSAKAAAQMGDDLPANDSSKLQVHIPHQLTREGGYDHREALFGIPPYGGSINQKVYYAKSDMCDPDAVDKSGWVSPYILMVDRGDCTFVQKVRNAQRSGAAAVIIADNSCLCSAGDACTSEPGEDCEPREPIMADDGSGSDITIPAFLMFKQDADLIKAQLETNTAVQMEMGWSLPSPDDRVEYDFWTTPTDLVARDFLGQFRDTAAALGSRAYFTPHMYIYDGILSNCQGEGGENQCYNLCSNSGRYCATDPDNNLDKGISGADVVKESLRRMCIWNEYGKENGVGIEWWNYVMAFMDKCDTETDFMDEGCVSGAYAVSGVDGKRIDDCMMASGGLDGNVANTILDEQLQAKETSGVVIIPAVFVNGAVLRGALEFKTVFQAVCAGYSSGTTPEVCRRCVSCPDEATCSTTGKCPGSSDGISPAAFGVAMLAMAGLFGAAFVWQYRKTKRAMREQVRGIVAEYMPLDEDFNDKDTQIT